MQEAIDDLRAALDQMNRSLTKLTEQNDEQIRLLQALLEAHDSSSIE